MKKWIKNILPRVKEHSKKLDNIESLVGKVWVLVDFELGYSTFRFLRDNRLLVTTDSEVSECSWELLSANALYIKGAKFKRILTHGVVFDRVLLLQKENQPNSLEIFYDSEKLDESTIQSYLIEQIISTLQLKEVVIEGRRYYFRNRYGLFLDDQLSPLPTTNLEFKYGHHKYHIKNGVIIERNMIDDDDDGKIWGVDLFALIIVLIAIICIGLAFIA